MRKNWPLPEKKELDKNLGSMSQFFHSAVHWPWILISLLFIILVTGGGTYWLYSNFANAESMPINIPQKNIRNKRTKNTSPKPNYKSSRPLKTVSQKVAQVKKEPIVVSTVTNSSGAIIQDLILPDGKTKRTIKPPRQIWDNAVNQLIAFAVSMEQGTDPAPLPTGVSDAEFIKALEKDITIFNDDTPKVKELKKTVREVRKDILKMMVETGKSFEEILNEHRDMVNSNTQFYREALKGIDEVAESGNTEDIDKYIRHANELLKQRGAKELPHRSAHGRHRGVKDL